MKQFRRLFACCLVVCLLGKSSAQSVDPGQAAALQHTLDSMRTVLNVKSLSASLQLPDGAIWAGAKGISSVSPLDSVTPDYTYAIGSVTKTITAACVLQLADEGLLTLDDPLHLWLDTIQYINPNITIRQLLRHQSGIYDIITDPDYQPEMWANFDSTYTLSDAVETFIHPPLFQPGMGWAYSNTNYLLLGMIIEKATGNTYYHEFRERFFVPLGMDVTAIIPFEPVPQDVAHLWLDITGDGITDDAHDLFIGWDSFNSSAGPAGSYYCTAYEMAVWMRAYMSGTLLSASLMEQLKMTVNTPFQGGTKYGLGIMERNFMGIKGYGHGGDVGYSASVFYFPEKDLSIAVLNNDSKNNSWTLAPVITALLQTYLAWPVMPSAVADNDATTVDLVAFPNPFHGTLNVCASTVSDEVQLVLTDVFGRTVASPGTALQADGQTIQLKQLEHLPTGTYFLHAMDGKKRATTIPVHKG